MRPVIRQILMPNPLALSIDFTTPVLDWRITASGGANGTRVDSGGLVVAATTPRFDYDPATLLPKGLLAEEARTNLCLWNRDLTNIAWVPVNITAAKTATGADGVANSASTLTATLDNGVILQTIVSGSAARVTSCWIKRRTGTGAIEMTQDNGTTWAAVTVTSSWTKVSIAAATLANPIIGFRIGTSGDAVDVDYVQQEVGAFITSSIATTSASVTRTAGSLTMTGTNFSDWFNAAEGTFVVEFDLLDAPLGIGTQGVYSAFLDGNNSISCAAAASDGRLSDFVYNGGVLQVSMSALGALAAGTVYRDAFAYRANDFARSLSGSAVQADASGSLPGPSQLRLGRDDGSGYLNGHIRSLRYYRKRLPNVTLQALAA